MCTAFAATLREPAVLPRMDRMQPLHTAPESHDASEAAFNVGRVEKQTEALAGPLFRFAASVSNAETMMWAAC